MHWRKERQIADGRGTARETESDNKAAERQPRRPQQEGAMAMAMDMNGAIAMGPSTVRCVKGCTCRDFLAFPFVLPLVDRAFLELWAGARNIYANGQIDKTDRSTTVLFPVLDLFLFSGRFLGCVAFHEIVPILPHFCPFFDLASTQQCSSFSPSISVSVALSLLPDSLSL